MRIGVSNDDEYGNWAGFRLHNAILVNVEF